MKSFLMVVFAVVVLAGCYEQPNKPAAPRVVSDGCAPYRVDAGPITAACG